MPQVCRNASVCLDRTPSENASLGLLHPLESVVGKRRHAFVRFAVGFPQLPERLVRPSLEAIVFRTDSREEGPRYPTD